MPCSYLLHLLISLFIHYRSFYKSISFYDLIWPSAIVRYILYIQLYTHRNYLISFHLQIFLFSLHLYNLDIWILVFLDISPIFYYVILSLTLHNKTLRLKILNTHTIFYLKAMPDYCHIFPTLCHKSPAPLLYLTTQFPRILRLLH